MPILSSHIYFTLGQAQLILSTTKPFAIGQLWKARSEQELSLKLEEFKQNGKTVCVVEGYNCFVMFDRNLENKKMFGIDIIESTELMANYFLTNHILPDVAKNPRYSIWNRYKSK